MCETNEMEIKCIKIYGMQQKQVSEVHSNKSLPQKTRKFSNNLALHLKKLGEEKKPKVVRRKEITKIREHINEIESKNTVEKIDVT